VVASPAANTPGSEVWPRASTSISPRGESLSVPLSQSVFGSRPIWTKMPSSSTWRFALADAVLVVDAGDLLAVAAHFGGQRAGDDGDVGQAAELGLQHGVGAQLAVEFEQRDVADDAGEVDRRLDAGIAAADHRHALAA
jgi:hypothetical protein